VIRIDDLAIAHLGDLGHELTDNKIEEIGDIDILLIPVGGVYTIDVKQANDVIREIQPSIVIPMHYATEQHVKENFGKLSTVQDFLEEGGFSDVTPQEKLSITKQQLPEEMEVVLLKR
jgi:L-ascorbate metabolism protein UlaG (beta-lactamase superfamily)